MDDGLENWLAERWEDRNTHQEELSGLLREMGSILNIERSQEDKESEYQMWRIRMINQWDFNQLPKEEQDRRLQEQIRQIRERRARKNAIRDN